MKPTDSEIKQEPTSPVRRGRRIVRYIVNIWLVVHLTAIFIAPATVGPSSGIARGYWEVVSPYLQLLYLNHGFHYFAPQPGSSNLVKWEAESNGEIVASGEFPNFEIQPRLLYHRHFMLSEYLGNSADELQPALASSFAAHLLEAHNADTVRLTQVRHNLPSMERIRAGGGVEDIDLFEEFELGVFQSSPSAPLAPNSHDEQMLANMTPDRNVGPSPK